MTTLLIEKNLETILVKKWDFFTKRGARKLSFKWGVRRDFLSASVENTGCGPDVTAVSEAC